jgi:hypothetical protein
MNQTERADSFNKVGFILYTPFTLLTLDPLHAPLIG